MKLYGLDFKHHCLKTDPNNVIKDLDSSLQVKRFK